MKKQLYILLITSFLITSCKEKAAVKSPLAEAAKSENIQLPPIPIDQLKNLIENANYVDYIFHNLPFSLSQDSKKSVQSNIGMIDPRGNAIFKKECPSMGREFFHVDGEIVMEAELYCSKEDNCYAYVFYVDGKPKYANGVTEAGRKFYQNMINQAMKATDAQ